MDIAYFEEAIDYLVKQKTIKSDKGIGVCGISKGAEVSLAMAAALPSDKLGAVAVLNALVSYSMVDVFYKQTKLCNCKLFRLNAIRIQFLKVYFVLTAWKPPFPPPKDCISEKTPNILNMSELVKHFPNKPETYIPFWNSDIPLLFVVGDDDQVCPSMQQAKIAYELMTKAGKQAQMHQSIHKSLGHLIDLPFSPPTTISPHVLFPKPYLVEMGGFDLLQHGQAQEKIWIELLRFFKLYL